MKIDVKAVLSKATKLITSGLSAYKYKIIMYSIVVAFLATSGAVVKSKYNDYIKTKSELAEAVRNEKAYKSIISNNVNDMRVLSLSKSELKNSNDSMIKVIESQRKLINDAKNKPGDIAAGLSTSISVGDTAKITNECNFSLDTTIVYNKYTKNHIKIEKDSLISSINVNNDQSLFVYTSRGYVNNYKSKLSRFLHLDWKKEDVLRFEVKNTNDKIVINQFRVYKIKE